MELTANQKMILSVRRAIWLSATPGARDRTAEAIFGAGFTAALNQVSPVLEGKIDADKLAADLGAKPPG